VYPPLKNYRNLNDVGKICVAIRAYIGHLTDQRYPIRRLLTCLEQMEYQNWVAIIFPTDEKNIGGIDGVLNARPEKYKERYKVVYPPAQPYVADDYGYKMTDWAIEKCPTDSKWLITTNGDNEYSPLTFSFLMNQFDGILFDFFSRHDLYWMSHHTPFNTSIDGTPNGEKCSKHIDHCYMTEPREKFIDLGAVIWNFVKWRSENMTYSRFSPVCCHDGILANHLQKSGWSITRIPLCLFSHSPNPWSECIHFDLHPDRTSLVSE